MPMKHFKDYDVIIMAFYLMLHTHYNNNHCHQRNFVYSIFFLRYLDYYAARTVVREVLFIIRIVHGVQRKKV